MRIPEDVETAQTLQTKMSGEVIKEDRLGEINYVAGIDIGFTDGQKTSQAAAVILSFPQLKVIETAVIRTPTSFPYITGLLSFREVPPALKALKQLTISPNLIICDGQGLAHPRRFGLACHLGVLTDTPAIGVAKSLLIGKHDPVDLTRGSWQPLKDKGEVIGAVLCTRNKTKPVYVSIGHKISLETAIDYVLRCTPRYRLPETTRQADRLSKD